MLDNLEITCPECGGVVKFSLNDVARRRTVRCSRGCNVELRDSNGSASRAARASRDLERSLDRLDKQLKRFGGGVSYE